MRHFSIFLCIALFASSATRGANPEPAGDAGVTPGGGEYVIGISPFLDAGAKDPVYRGLVRLIVEDLPLNSTVEVYDAYQLKSITRMSIPNAKVFDSPKTRANQFAPAIGEIRQFLANVTPKPGGTKGGFEGAIRLPQFCDFLAQERAGQGDGGSLPVLLIGSPLYQDTREPAFSMVDGYFPSDGHLKASREESVFGYKPGEGATQKLAVYWTYFGDPWMSDLHREKVARFWALYMERRGGRVASFSEDLVTAMGAFSRQAPGKSAAANGWVADALQTRPEMVRATRNVGLVDWLTGDGVGSDSPPPSRLTGPLKIGIRWKEEIDLDLYATPHAGAETLFFDHARSPEGYYFKDHRSSPGREFEYIEFESPVDVRDVRAFVNYYKGSTPEGPRGEVRIEFQNRIYRGTFEIESSEGNQGRSGRSQSRFWTEIPIQKILRIGEAPGQSASNSR